MNISFKTLQKKPRLEAATTWRDIFIVNSVLLLCSLIGFLFHSLELSEANIISIYILGILLISSITSSWVYGTISSVCGVLLFNFLYADPIFNFRVYDVQYFITTLVMLVASLLANYVMTLFRIQLKREKLETFRLDILLETSQQLQQVQSLNDIFNVAAAQLYQMLWPAVAVFPLVEGKLAQPVIKCAERDLNFFAEAFALEKNRLEQFVAAESEDKYTVLHISNEHDIVCFKLMSRQTLFALVCIVAESNKRLITYEYNLVLAMVDEVALSVEKYNLHLFNERIAREAEAEKLRTNLLRTISHDLRTPLTSISGNADILLSNGEQIEPDLRKQMYQNIYSDSEWLINLVENLLFVTRIDNGVMAINTEYEALQEIVQESLSSMAKRTKGHNLSLEMADEIIVVKADARLLMQVVVNIVDNAIKYTPAGSDINVRVFRRGGQGVVEVADTGGGISDDDKKKVFEMFYTTNKNLSDSRRGIGLGLPLCLSIINAHGGTISITDNTPSGAIISFALNLEEVCIENQCIGG